MLPCWSPVASSPPSGLNAILEMSSEPVAMGEPGLLAGTDVEEVDIVAELRCVRAEHHGNGRDALSVRGERDVQEVAVVYGPDVMPRGHVSQDDPVLRAGREQPAVGAEYDAV